MVNPHFTQKKEISLTISENAKKLLKVIYLDKNNQLTEVSDSKIKVSHLISKMAFYYEKIRNTVDYNEEHLLRKNAIERILKREIVIQGALKKAVAKDVSKHLIIELIRAAYLPNDTIPETKLGEITDVIDKYLRLKDCCIAKTDPGGYLKVGDVNNANKELKVRQEITNWILALAASDIEERLGKEPVNEEAVYYMYDVLNKNITVPDNSSFEKDLKIQIYTGIYKNFLSFDDDMLSFVLFKYFVPNWDKATDDDLKNVSLKLPTIQRAIEKQLNHPFSSQLNRIISKYTVFFSILIEVIKEDPENVFEAIRNNRDNFNNYIKEVCGRRYREVKIKLWRSAFRSIVYIFITKSVFALLLEVPASRFFGQEINNVSLAINISFPALLLFVVVFFTKKPNSENTSKIVDGINEIVFKEYEKDEPKKLKKPSVRSRGKNIAFGIIYGITFFMSFGFIVWALDKIHFNWVSIIIFIFFLAFVSFFTIRIRKRIKDLMVVEPKENILTLFSDFFYTPIVASGKWLSDKFSKINVFVFILDFIIEAPFKIFVSIAEEWTKYVRERKDEI